MNTRLTRVMFVSLLAAVFTVGTGFINTQSAHAQTGDGSSSSGSYSSGPYLAPVLSVTGISPVANSGGWVGYATANGTFDNGWRWVFNVTVPTSETVLKMQFDNWTNGSNKILATNNIRFYSVQSSNAYDEGSAIKISAANSESGEMDLTGDANSTQDGRQIQITVEVAVPSDSAGGSYSTSYGIQSIDPDIATVAAAKSAIAGATYSDLQVTDTANQDQKTAAVQAVVDAAKGTTVAVAAFNAGTGNYDVAISKGVDSDSTSVTATFSQSVADAAALASAKSTAHIALTDALATYTSTDYTADNWTTLTDFKTAGDVAIDNAATTGDVTSAQNTATAGMAGVQTIAQTTAAATVAKLAADHAAADPVTAQIDALPATAALVLSDKAAVDSASTAFNALTSDQQALVTNSALLTADMSQIATLQATADANG